MKYMHKIFLGLMVAISSVASVRADEDEFADMDLNGVPIEDIAAAGVKQASESVVPAICVVENFVDNLNGIDLLKKRLYKRSNPIYSRSIHDLPFFAATCAGDGTCLSVRADPFYNQMSKMFFIKEQGSMAYEGDRSNNPKSVASYIDMQPGGLLDTSLNKSGELELFENIDSQRVLALFSSTRMQERRVGIYLGLGANRNNWTVQFAVPLYYLERNFFMTQVERNAMSVDPAISSLASGSDEAALEKFLTKHMASDSIGLGDMRFHLLYTPYRSECTRATFGAVLTLPTAFAFSKGLIGGAFCKKTDIAPFSLEEPIFFFTCLDLKDRKASVKDKIKKNAVAFGLSALDRLTANLADSSLGNSGHVALGPILECTHRFCDKWEFFAQGSVQYLFENEELRDFILKDNNPSAFDKYVDKYKPATEKIAQEDIAFFNQKLQDILFFSVVPVKVRPGMIAHGLASFAYTYKEWIKMQLGYDLWWRGDECVTMSPALKQCFEYCRGLSSSAIQHKLFAGITGELQRTLGVLKLGLGADMTVASNGIGKDFTLALKVQFDF